MNHELWKKAVARMHVNSLENDLDEIFEHFLSNQIDSFKPKYDVNYFYQELTFYKFEYEKYFLLNSQKVDELFDEYKKLEALLVDVSSKEEFMEFSVYQGFLEEDMYSEVNKQKIHFAQEYSGMFSLFEGTLRQCAKHARDKKNINISKCDNGLDEFKETFKRIFPKNNTEWKRINGIYKTINDVIKHNDMKLPEKKFGLTEILNFANRKDYEVVKDKKIEIDIQLNSELYDDLVNFAELPKIQKVLDNYYRESGKLELPTTFDFYNSFSNLYHKIESTLNNVFLICDSLLAVEYDFFKIKKTGVSQIKEYIVKNNVFLDLNEDEFFNKFNDQYRYLENRIKHYKGNVVPLVEEDKEYLKNFSIDMSNSNLKLNFDFLLDFYESSKSFLHRFNKYISSTI